MNRSITLAGPDRWNNYTVVETSNYLLQKPGARLDEEQAVRLADSEVVTARFVPAPVAPQEDVPLEVITSVHNSREQWVPRYRMPAGIISVFEDEIVVMTIYGENFSFPVEDGYAEGDRGWVVVYRNGKMGFEPRDLDKETGTS